MSDMGGWPTGPVSPGTLCRLSKGCMLAPGLAFATVITVLFLPLSVRPMDGDPALYAYIGDRVANGDILYKDVWDVKPPGFPLMYAAAFKILGRHIWSPAVLEMALLWFATLGLFKLGSGLGGSLAGWSAATFYLWAYWGVSVSGMALQAEGMAAPFLIWPFALAVRRPFPWWQAGVSGILIAWAAMIKTPLAIFAVPWILMSGFGRHLVGFFLGVLLIAGGMLAYLKVNHIVWEAKYTLIDFAARFVSERRQPISRFWATLAHMAGGLWVVIAANWVGALYALSQRRLSPIWVAILISLVLTFWQATFWNYHWFLMHLFSAVAVGCLLADLLRPFGKKSAFAAAVVLLAMIVPKPGALLENWGKYGRLISGTLPWLQYAEQFSTAYGAPPATPINEREMFALAMDLKRRTHPSDYIWTAQMVPSLTFLAERREPVRFLYPDGVFVKHPLLEIWRAEYIRNVVQRRPRFIVFCRECCMPYRKPMDLKEMVTNTPQLLEFFEDNYVPDSNIRDILEVYRLKD